MTGYHTIRGGRFKCDFCDHKSYKTLSGILNHVQGSHELEVAKATADGLREELQRERNKAPKIKTVEKIVYKEKPEPKYWYTKTVGIAGIYCSSCKQVILNPGIPTGQTIENTPHQCGNRTLFPVVEVK